MGISIGGELKVFNLPTLNDDGSRGQVGGVGNNMVGLFIGLMIAAIVVLQVFIPVVNDAVASADLGTTVQTIVDLLPLFAALLLLIALAGPLMRRV